MGVKISVAESIIVLLSVKICFGNLDKSFLFNITTLYIIIDKRQIDLPFKYIVVYN